MTEDIGKIKEQMKEMMAKMDTEGLDTLKESVEAIRDEFEKMIEEYENIIEEIEDFVDDNS